MKLTRKVKQILSCYEGDNPGTKANLARILMHGRLGGTRSAGVVRLVLNELYA